MDQDKKCVLVVDDTPSYIALLNIILQKKYAVKGVTKGKIALNIVREKPASVDLIMLDIMMDGMDGFEVCRALKADSTTAHIPVVFISGREEKRDREKGLALGAVDFITKPFSAETVLETAAKYLSG